MGRGGYGGKEEVEKRGEKDEQQQQEEEEEEEEEDSVDPVMLKYMELVKQKRAEERERQPPALGEDHSESRHSQVSGGWGHHVCGTWTLTLCVALPSRTMVFLLCPGRQTGQSAEQLMVF